MKKHGNTKTIEDFFLKSKIIINILGSDFSLSNEQIYNLEEFFKHYNDKDRSSIWRKNIAIWIKHGLDDWIARREKLSQVASNSLDFFELMYGQDQGRLKYNTHVSRVTKNFSNTIEYWTARGFTQDEAVKRAKEVQRQRNKKSVIKNKGSSEHTIRSKLFWLKQGYTEQEAANMVASLQRRDEAFFINKYGVIEGTKRYNQSIAKRKETWKAKDKKEHALKTTPRSFNKSGQEMKAITSFLKANRISEIYCKFGAPKDQFYQWIPDVGFRRYDLAVFEDLEHTKLKYILEYHGPGHINFSDFVEELRDEKILLNGKTMLHLGTYGAAYDNDLCKRNHILNNYPNVKYLVMWPEDLKNGRFLINELLR